MAVKLHMINGEEIIVSNLTTEQFREDVNQIGKFTAFYRNARNNTDNTYIGLRNVIKITEIVDEEEYNKCKKVCEEYEKSQN